MKNFNEKKKSQTDRKNTNPNGNLRNSFTKKYDKIIVPEPNNDNKLEKKYSVSMTVVLISSSTSSTECKNPMISTKFNLCRDESKVQSTNW